MGEACDGGAKLGCMYTFKISSPGAGGSTWLWTGVIQEGGAAYTMIPR